MKRHSAGYTILEVIIFLSISAALFGAIYPTLSGRQQSAQFSQSVRDLDSKIQDVINDVSTGYFPGSQVGCTVSGESDSPVLTSSPLSAQGTQKDCVFLGKVIHFNGNNTDDPTMNIFTVVGRRQKDNVAVTKLTDAKPVTVAPTNFDGSRPDLTETYPIKWGFKVNKVVYLDVAETNASTGDAFAEVTKLSDSNQSSKQVDLVPIISTVVDENNDIVAGKIDSNGSGWNNLNPTKGMLICIQNPRGDDRSAAILVGGRAGIGKTEVIFDKVNIDELGGANICA